ncbi:hypothetical protein [Mammaliicoccus fleurettii]|uniref:hypothetical protein n=1 Tax=Mammaliicoccus fleurettii TaxID=150056 RepID=UPI002DBE2A46|nr:hypothetical protein [Mammaliicoccus fleurettii]MEB7781276.1 hypothetical protein [Mammaliicoccus fleurettii]MEB8067371.1 hypothetical protein [Mammaliicoccus fleurettii]
MEFIPKYTRLEIINLVKKQLSSSNYSHESKEQLKLNDSIIKKITSDKSIWTVKEYKLIADILSIDIEDLTSYLPEEELNHISFRALENNEEINQKVKQINEIFELLTYQLKIGSNVKNGEI